MLCSVRPLSTRSGRQLDFCTKLKTICISSCRRLAYHLASAWGRRIGGADAVARTCGSKGKVCSVI